MASAEAAVKEAGSRFERRAATLQHERAAAEEALGRAEAELQALQESGAGAAGTPDNLAQGCQLARVLLWPSLLLRRT